MTAPITQTETFDATPEAIWQILTDGERFSEMSGGAPAEIDSNEGGAISLFGGMITGRTIEAVPNERLVQAWRPQPWEAGVYSTVRFEIAGDGASTTVTLDHRGYPEGEDEHLAQGWHDNYWNNLRALVGS